MNTEITTIETTLTPKELTEKLQSMTVTDFSQLQNPSPASYYGEITSYSFNIMNVRYGPMSSFPPIRGEIQEGVNKTIIKIKMDIEENYKISRTMYYTTLLPIGIIVMLLSFLVLGGTEYQLQGFIFSSSFIVCAILVVFLTKSSLVSTKKRELNNFATKINGKIISA
ncbi:MAG: hypothetical protein HUU48_06160 [Flavobacteriales bacterium]|nr:hypothetical protein [Flavobacteriales bacterium]